METLIDTFGEPTLMLALGLMVGTVFGLAAYRSRFCLRAATAELAEGRVGPKLMIWLAAFTTAVVSVQSAIWIGALDVSNARQLASVGSMSGAIIGGLMFGVGMILARGCASRLLVLSASGNMRAIITGLVLTLTAQASLSGFLSPVRENLAGLWLVNGGAARALFAPESPLLPVAIALCATCLMAVLVFGPRLGAPRSDLVGAVVVGLAVYAGWQGSYAIANASFEMVAVQSVTFTGPSTDTLMTLVTAPTMPASFGMGLVPGVFFGAMVAAFVMGEARIQRFEPNVPMERYLLGGVLMGFGSMLAGGCAVGAGMSGGAIFAMTAWVAVLCMWIGAMTTHVLLDAMGDPKLI